MWDPMGRFQAWWRGFWFFSNRLSHRMADFVQGGPPKGEPFSAVRMSVQRVFAFLRAVLIFFGYVLLMAFVARGCLRISEELGIFLIFFLFIPLSIYLVLAYVGGLMRWLVEDECLRGPVNRG